MIPFLVFITGAKIRGHAGFGSVKARQFFFPAGKWPGKSNKFEK
jgi:hypothetical protein